MRTPYSILSCAIFKFVKSEKRKVIKVKDDLHAFWLMRKIFFYILEVSSQESYTSRSKIDSFVR